jgi:cell division protein FtsB
MQIEKYQEQVLTFVRRMSDIRFAGQVLFVIIVLLISWSGIKTIQTNYGLQKEITALQQENSLQELKNNNLALQNEYYKSEQYLELSARQNFGLAAPGEKVVIVPENVALRHTVDLPEDDQKEPGVEIPTFQRNFKSWTDFFFNRRAAN